MMKQFNKKRVIILSVCTLLYAWILGICGLYGDTVMHILRTAMFYTLKYGGSAFGLFMLWFVPIRISMAIEQNRINAQNAYEKAQEQLKLNKLMQEEKIKTALAEHYEDLKNE